MFSRKKKPAPAKERARNKLAVDFDLGIPGLNQNQKEDDADLEAELFALTGERSKEDDVSFGTGDDDDDLEAELARLIGGRKKKGKPPGPSYQAPSTSLHEMKNGLELLDSDEEPDDVDENDPELLNELQMLTIDDDKEEEEEDNTEEAEATEEMSQLELIKSRMDMYKTAEAKAKSSNESSRARRFNRGVKTLEKLLKRVQKGEMVPYDEIPPEIATNLKPAPLPTALNLDEPQEDNASGASSSISHAESTSVTSAVDAFLSSDDGVDKTSMSIVVKKEKDGTTFQQDNDEGNVLFLADPLLARGSVPLPRPEHKEPAAMEFNESPTLVLLNCRRDEYRKHAVAMKKSGDLSGALQSVRAVKDCEKLIDLCQAGNVIVESQIPPSPFNYKKPQKINELVQKSANVEMPCIVGDVFTVPTTVLEALNQRLNYYMKAFRKAEVMGLRSEVRKWGDTVRIYQNAIRLHQRGSKVPFEKLPTPPGCPPIPLAFKIN